MTKVFNFFILSALFSGLAFSQNLISKSPEIANNSLQYENGTTHSLGFTGAMYKTSGFNYRQHFSNNFGMNVALGGWFRRTGGYLANTLGLSYTLAHHKFRKSSLPNSSVRIYLLGKLANIHNFNDSYDYSFEPPGRRRKDKKLRYAVNLGLGVGPGAEFFLNKHFAAFLEVPWMTFVEIKKGSTQFLRSYPHVGAGLSYYF